MDESSGNSSAKAKPGSFTKGNAHAFKKGKSGNPFGRLPKRALPAVQRVLSSPMTRQMQIDSVADECKVSALVAETYLERGRDILRKRRLTGDTERDEQLERLRRAMATALVRGNMSAYASMESTFAEIAGTKQPRKTELSGRVEVETWSDLAKLGEQALKERP